MKTFRLFLSLIILILLFSCQDKMNFDKNSIDLQKKNNKGGITLCNKEIKIAILSDIHVMDPNLLVGYGGSAFDAYLTKDPKLLKYSAEILNLVVYNLIPQKPDVVLICGDLTKDGEKVSHETVVGILKRFTDNGIKVLVTPGNHDVNNPEALKFNGAITTPVATIQAADFSTIYADYGFKNAISRDANSLSYVNEPITGLWVISIDANKYYENNTLSTVGGVIKPETLRWVKQQLVEAKNKGKTVIGMMHHGLIEHYVGQNQIDPGYVVDNSDEIAKKLMDDGMKIILTGHYHAFDITKREHANKFIFDVETGSPVVTPWRCRTLTIKNNEFSFDLQTFLTYNNRKHYTSDWMVIDRLIVNYFANLLQNVYGIPVANVPAVTQFFSEAAGHHFWGDEIMPTDIGGQLVYLNSLDPSGKLAWILSTLYTDINTPDNHVTINMVTGEAL